MRKALFFLSLLIPIAVPLQAQQATFGGTGNPFAIRDQVRQKIQERGLPYTVSGSSAVVFLRSEGGTGRPFTWDDNGQQHLPTLNKICEILGYNTYVRSTCLDQERSGRYPRGKCNFHSPDDNDLSRFHPSLNNFRSENANPKYGKTFVSTITCDDPITECNDEIDNDQDGVADNLDPGCWDNPQDPQTYNPRLNNEGRATTQCQDRNDNDGDRLTDREDPGCWNNPKNPNTYNPLLNNESRATTECQDRGDNDEDGVSDANDPGCWTNPQNPNTYDPTLNDEGRATTQCQDGLDNDNDRFIDSADPGCWTNPNNPQTYNPILNNEAGATSQCQDGVDNDQDGVVDASDPGCWTNPLDPNTYDPKLNDERRATTQCQDGFDNDSDALSDSADPGCWENPAQPNTYNPLLDNEARATSQCQDGLDNDGDGAIDFPADFSCSSPTDHDEFLPRAQCQDGLDNDNNGVFDAADAGCYANPEDPTTYNPQDNSESTVNIPECLDGKDNDNDGLTDAQDPSCYRNPDDPSTYDPTFDNEARPTEDCLDGFDNDGDGLIDFPEDPDCTSPTDDTEGPNGDEDACGVDPSVNDIEELQASTTSLGDVGLSAAKELRRITKALRRTPGLGRPENLGRFFRSGANNIRRTQEQINEQIFELPDILKPCPGPLFCVPVDNLPKKDAIEKSAKKIARTNRRIIRRLSFYRRFEDPINPFNNFSPEEQREIRKTFRKRFKASKTELKRVEDILAQIPDSSLICE